MATESILGGRSLTVRDQEHLLRERQTMLQRAKNAAMEHKKQIEKVTDAGIGIASAAGIAYVEGRWTNRAQIANVALGVWLAGLGLAVGVTGYGGEEVSNAALAAGVGIGSFEAGMAAYKKGQKSAAATPAT